MTTISLLPRRRPPGTKYGKWTEEEMNNAIADVNDGIGINRSSRDNGVPKATLLRHLYNKNVHANASKKHFGRCTDLPEAVEMELAKHVIKLGEQNCGMTTKSLRHLAYEIAEAHHLKHRFNNDTEMAGKAWERRFRRSHPELSLRTPQPTSVTRLTAFTTDAVKQFFQLLKEALKQNDLCQSRIFNVDETGINIVHRLSKVFAKRGSKQVRGVTSAERGKNVTCVCCVSASGAYVPPMIIFPRKRIPELLKRGAPPGSIFVGRSKGWIDKELFVMWLKHFVAVVKCTKECPILLVLDGHVSHTQSIKALDFARKSGVIMLSLPPHCTHHMQPLDVSFFKPLKNYYHQAAESRMRQNHGKALSMYDISGLFGAAYLKAATISNGVSGFSKTGIWPVDENMFKGVTFNDRTDTTSPNVATSIATNSVQAAPTATSVTTLVSPQDTSGSRAAMCSKIDSSTKVTSQHAVKCDDIDMPSETPNGNDILARKTFFEHILLAMEKLTTTKELLSFCASPSCRIPDRFEIPAQHVTTIVASKLTVDKVALQLYPNEVILGKIDPATRFPVIVLGDGNCLPRAGSVIAFGDEDHFTEMRVRIVIESVLDDDEVLQIVPNGAYMGIWQIMALSSVCQRRIHSTYPNRGNVNVRADLHRLVVPRTSETSPAAEIMWSSARDDMKDAHWAPNHFAPVVYLVAAVTP